MSEAAGTDGDGRTNHALVSPRVPRELWPSLVCHVLHERLGEPVTLEALGWAHAAPLQFAKHRVLVWPGSA